MIAAVMIAVDIVNERTRKVYQLFAIRPISRGAILWSKFLAVFGCVSVACVLSLVVGVIVDIIRGSSPSGEMLYEVARAFATQTGVIAVSAGGGVFIGILSRTSIVAAVILVLQVSQNLAVIPLLPGFFGVLPNQFWFVILASYALAALLVHGGAAMFKRAEL
jgi:ABC-type transport system involved in multi-copper enzyme maturation permease subunit